MATVTPRLAALVDAVLPRVGIALAVYRLGLLTLEVTALRTALEHERDRRLAAEGDRCRERQITLAAEARVVRWRASLGEAWITGLEFSPFDAGQLEAPVRAILDE